MAQVSFFAARQDQRQIIEFLYDQTDFRVFELCSKLGQQLREFKSFDELDSTYRVGVDTHGNGFAIPLCLWSASVTPERHIVRLELDPKRCDGHSFRYTTEGWGAIRLDLGGVYERVITKSSFSHWSERGARSRGYKSGVDWAALSKLSNRVSYHISSRLAVAKAPGRPILSEAYALHGGGYELKESVDSNFVWTATAVSTKKSR